MGLAASQARFLGLTARKSNVEYQGQQINQQRVALSNEIMGLYTKYNDLEPPVPPAVQDYQKAKYVLDSTYEGYEIESFSKILSGDNEGYYDVSLSWEEEIAKAYSFTAKDSVITATKKDGEPTDGAFSYLNIRIGLDTYTYDENDEKNSTITKITGDYEKYQGLSTIMKNQELTDGTFYMFMKNGTAYYTSEEDLLLTEFENQNGKDTYYGDYSFDYQGLQNITRQATAVAALTQESSGRLSTIQILDSPENQALKDKTFSITTSQKDNQLAYEDAMNQYYYDKAKYEREVEKINMKTEEIQEQDRALELQIGQLDTEQNALSTEMDSVKKVIEDTMEKVFKTFSS